MALASEFVEFVSAAMTMLASVGACMVMLEAVIGGMDL